MRSSLFLAVAIALVVSGPSLGQAKDQEEPKGLSDRTRALKFLREHVVGKTVSTPETIVKYAGNKVEGVYSSSDSYTNLVETVDGFQFDVVTASKLTNYDLDKEEKRIEPGRIEDGTYLARYDLTERRSTGKLVGTVRIISSTNKTFPPGLTMAVVFAVQDRSLTSTEHSLFYEDFFEAKGKWKAGASESKSRFFLEEGKLRVEGENLQFDVDPKTLTKTRTADPPLKWTSKQRN